MIRAVFLASGRGKRFGGGKLLYEADGIPMAERVFAALPPDIPGYVVTSDPNVAELASPHKNLTVLRNPDDRDDIALTIRTGTHALPPDTEGALFLVCDQPWLTKESIERLTGAFAEDEYHIYVLSDGERMGNPCLFPREFFSELCALPPDTGGKAVIRCHPERVRLVPAVSRRELEDIDYRPSCPGNNHTS